MTSQTLPRYRQKAVEIYGFANSTIDVYGPIWNQGNFYYQNLGNCKIKTNEVENHKIFQRFGKQLKKVTILFLW